MTKELNNIMNGTIKEIVDDAVEKIVADKLNSNDRGFELIIMQFSHTLSEKISAYSLNDKFELLKMSVLMLMEKLKEECPFLTGRVYYNHHLTTPTRFALARSLRRKLHYTEDEKSIITQLTAGTSDSMPIIPTDGEDLISATQMNNISLVKELLKRGVNVNTCGERPLLNAIENNQLEIVELLLKYGANHRFYFFEPLRTCLELNNMEIGYHLAKLDNGIDMEELDKRVNLTPEMAQMIKEINTRISYENLEASVQNKQLEPFKKGPKI